MIRIVGMQRSECPEQEFILLQNQGSMRITLRGHTILSESSIGGTCGELGPGAHVFGDDEIVPPGMYVLLVTGKGTPRWGRSKDGALIYHAYMGRERALWSRCELPLHLLSTQHSYVERGEALLMR